jgi:hypothetical protein
MGPSFASYATVSIFRPSPRAVDMVISAVGVMAILKIWCRLKNGFFDSYRPELHYMRGPGPKWREKHAGAFGPNAAASGSISHGLASRP